ncbi:MAG TPA: PASTA domain-containing protein [Gillisia sp.]|nr:PASTA domain-containing protein [Gillisia sp.]
MSFIKFLFSKTFLIQIALAILALVVIAFLTMQWLNFSTNQDQRIEVPDLSKLSLTVVEDRLDELDLRYEILDSANFNPDFPRYAVIDQTPASGSYVKENRKIYLTLNPSGYRKVTMPDLITVRRTRRQVEPTLRSLGFEIGDITYKPDVAMDVVLELRHKGSLVKPGDELMKTSVIDLVLGDGQDRFRLDGEDDDSLNIDEEPFEEDFNDEF